MQRGKFILLGITLLCMLCGSSAMHAQPSGPKVTLNMQDATVRDVLKSIEKSTDYAFFYNDADFNAAARVSVKVDNESVESVVSRILPGFGCRFDNKKIILVKTFAGKQSQKEGTPEPGYEISGLILDTDGIPLAGASAILRYKGKLYGDVAGLDGKFRLVLPGIPAENTSISFSFVGFADETMPIGNRAYFEVVLKDDSQLLSESVVVGYGVQKKVNLTGAVSAVSEETLKDRPVANVGQALQGVIPNLNITQNSGRPDAGSTYNIRGNTSPNGGSPLILVDGVETYLERINSNDIESISVLKDASSAAIYGARGAFGVILVTTKSGKFDAAPKVSASARFSFSDNTSSTDYETRGYYSAYIADLFMSTKGGVPYTKYTAYDYQRLWERRNDKVENPERPWVVTEMRDGRLSYVYLANFDWYNYMFDDSRPTQDYNVNVTGGSKNVSYMVSGRYTRQEGIFRTGPDNYDSFNARAKVDIRIRPWLKLSSNTKFFNGTYFYHGNNYRRATLHALASFVPMNPDGTAVSHTTLTNSSSHYIMDGYSAMLLKGKQWGRQRTTEVTTSWALKADITRKLSFNADFSYKFGYLRKEYRDATVEYSMYPGEILQESLSSYRDRLSDTVYEQNNYVANAYIAYDNTWNDAHHFTGTLGYNYEARHYKDLSVRRNDLLTEELSDFNMATGDIDVLTGGISEYTLSGLFFRLTYDYKSRYLFEVNGRYDGSSRFLKGHRYGFFPSVSAAYRISEEPFMKSVKQVMNNAKIRLSYGSLGNQNIGYYDYYQSVNTKGNMSYSFDGQTLAGHAVVDDPVSTGTWETVETKNIGLDLGFFRDKLTFTGDMYIRDTKGILTKGKQLPSIYGASEPMVNANDIRTKGWEIQISWKDSFMVGGHRFDYNVGGHLADYTARYTRADNPSGIISEPYVGKQLGEIWGFRVGGLFQSDAEAAEYASRVDMSQVCEDYYVSVGDYGKGVRGGDMKYLDLDGDNVLTFGSSTLEDSGDREVIGNSQPRFMYGFNAGFNFFGFDFSIFFQGIGHQDWYPGSDNQRFWGPYSRPYTSFVGKDFMADVWSETNKEAYFPRARGYSALNKGSLYYTNDRYLQNLAYLRLKNLTVGYTIPQKALAKAGISNLRVYFSGENLWYTSPLRSKYVDPEFLAVASDKNGDTYSFYKTFSFGVTLDF
ncbi:MAG: TonB-dependent receptor [Bacteroides sp.]|nr:TonB-dependent receptor [Bacteroides sp.]